MEVRFQVDQAHRPLHLYGAAPLLNFWQEIQSSEYGFWANVSPQVPHPRWSQAEEEVLGRDEKVPTVLYNGYGEFVPELYKDLRDEPLFI